MAEAVDCSSLAGMVVVEGCSVSAALAVAADCSWLVGYCLWSVEMAEAVDCSLLAGMAVVEGCSVSAALAVAAEYSEWVVTAAVAE
jgi:hypothetical protein